MNKYLIAAVAFGAGYYFATKQIAAESTGNSAVGLPRVATNYCEGPEDDCSLRYVGDRAALQQRVLNPYRFIYNSEGYPYAM